MTTTPNPAGDEPGEVWILLEEAATLAPQKDAELRQLLHAARATGGDVRPSKQKRYVGTWQAPTWQQWLAVNGFAGEQQRREAFAVVRVQRRDGAATLGILGDREFDEANVWDAGDLADRLAAAADHPELIVSFRAGDSDQWLTVDDSAALDEATE